MKLVGTIGTLYGVVVAHISNYNDNRLHTDNPEDCWCWAEEATGVSNVSE